MTTEELRIGNFVLHCGEWQVVHSIDQLGINIIQPLHRMVLKNLSPIILTPEILEKCGFEKHTETTGPPINEEMDYYSDGEISVFFTHTGRLLIRNYHVNQAGCTSLHHFQNLYYSLTNNELQLK